MDFLRVRLVGRCVTYLVGLALAVAMVQPTGAVAQTANLIAGIGLVVKVDRGGKLGQRARKIAALRATGERVELRGTCLSACTMYLDLPGACVGPEAVFGFHGPSRDGRPLPALEFEHWSKLMAAHYREPLRGWFMSEGRFRTAGYFRISGAELIRMGYPAC